MTLCDWQPDGGAYRCPRCGDRSPEPLDRRCPTAVLPCDYRGAPTGRSINWKPCADKNCRKDKKLPVLTCDRHRLCTLERSAEYETGLVQWCRACPSRQVANPEPAVVRVRSVRHGVG